MKLSGVLHLSYSERQQGEQGRRRPDEAAGEPCVWYAATHGVGQRDEAVEAHPGQKEDAAVHVGLLEEVHESAEAGLVVVALLKIEHLNQRVSYQKEVSHGQIHEVAIWRCHAAPVVKVYHYNKDIPNKTDRKQEYGVEAGEDEADKIIIIRSCLRTIGGDCLCVIWMCTEVIVSNDFVVHIYGHVHVPLLSLAVVSSIQTLSCHSS